MQTFTNKLKRWKEMGLISDDYLTIYNRWKDSTNCEKCGHDYSYWTKCMDHCHSTGEFRAILCHNCNMNDNSRNKSGYPNISYDKNSNLWRYQKCVKKIKYQVTFKTKNEAIIYKWLFEAGYSVEL
tara:strand:- start:51 stop:428 length:378 start_codon:yes stop_codon:yes gene_type:complete